MSPTQSVAVDLIQHAEPPMPAPRSRPVDPRLKRLKNQRHELRRLNRKVEFTAGREGHWHRLVDLYRSRINELEYETAKRTLSVGWTSFLYWGIGIAVGYFIR